MDGAKRSDLLTTDYCDRKIGELFKQQNMGWGKSEEDLLLITTEIAVLQRLREHVVNGEMITINEKEEIKWWADLKTH